MITTTKKSETRIIYVSGTTEKIFSGGEEAQGEWYKHAGRSGVIKQSSVIEIEAKKVYVAQCTFYDYHKFHGSFPQIRT